MSAPILALPESRDGKFDIHCDASKVAGGGVFTQLQSVIRRTIAYCAHELTDRQSLHAAYDRDLLSLHRISKEWAPIVRWSHVTVHTDHRTLTHILHQRTHSSRQLNKLWYISYCDFDIKPIAGEKNVIADCLSRPTGPGEAPEVLFSLAIATAEDKELDACKPRAQTLYPQDEWFGPVLRTIKGDALEGLSAAQVAKASARADRFHLSDDNLLVTKDGDRLAIPGSTIQRDVCDCLHTNPVGTHFCRERTLDALQRRFYWPRMDRTLRQCIMGGDPCARVKIDLKPPMALSQRVPIPKERWQKIGVDFITKMRKGKPGKY